MKNIKIITLKDGKFIEKNVKCTLDSIKNEANGNIELVFSYKGIDIFAKEDVENTYKLPSLLIVDSKNNLLDKIYGNIVFTRHNVKGDMISLNNSQIKNIRDKVRVIIFYNKDINKLSKIHCLTIDTTYGII